MIPHLELLLLRLREELPHLLLRSPDVFVQNFRPVHDLGLARVQYLTDLARYQCLPAPRRSEEQHAPDVVNTQLLYDVGRPYPGRERPPEDLVEFGVETADAELFEVEVGEEDGVGRSGPSLDLLANEGDEVGSLGSGEGQDGRGEELPYAGRVVRRYELRALLLAPPSSSRRRNRRKIHLVQFVNPHLHLRPLEVHRQRLPRLEHVSLVIQQKIRRQSIRVDLPRRRSLRHGLLLQQVHLHLQRRERIVRRRREGTDLHPVRER
mmetsp:Transcript_5993/g.15009  ORF Transcript_5993/g.15009 Transcript_5993/m.15009 type:complete len:265 (-) Transcript_5993:350-1144(-)